MMVWVEESFEKIITATYWFCILYARFKSNNVNLFITFV